MEVFVRWWNILNVRQPTKNIRLHKILHICAFTNCDRNIQLTRSVIILPMFFWVCSLLAILNSDSANIGT